MVTEILSTSPGKKVNPMVSHLDSALSTAAKAAAPYWWVRSFIAVNSLQGFEDREFSSAIEAAADLYRSQGFLSLKDFKTYYDRGLVTEKDLRRALSERNLPGVSPEEAFRLLFEDFSPSFKPVHAPTPASLVEEGSEITTRLNHHCITWLSAFLDEGQASWKMPERELGFFGAWKKLAPYDGVPWLRSSREFRKKLSLLPNDPKMAAQWALEQMRVAPEYWADVLTRHVAALPGWCGFIQMRSKSAGDIYQANFPIDIPSYLAVRLFYELNAVESFSIRKTGRPFSYANLVSKPKEKSAESGPLAYETKGEVWLRALELGYRAKLLKALSPAGEPAPDFRPVDRPAAQWVFCIDVRSEGIRRHLEANGDCETFGFAGFFGLAVEYTSFDGCTTKQCPVLIEPAYRMKEAAKSDQALKDFDRSHRLKKLMKRVLYEVKNTTTTAFAFVEVFGAFFALPLIARSGRIQKQAAKPPEASLTLEAAGGFGMSLEAQVATAEGALRMMGLHRQFARIVVLAGHGGKAENNPFASSLDCGACGGNSGSVNARLAAQLFNSPKVREGLKARGISIPEDTVFVAAKHETTTDSLEWVSEVPDTHRSDWEALSKKVAAAGEALTWERFRRFENPLISKSDANVEARRRASDWSEVRPEWGLAGNAAFIVGPRRLTQGLNLECRTFLHSYDYPMDPEGKSLEVILTAPLVVAQWINSQYYFSSVDNAHFGSGNKVLHNLVGKVGVMEGNESDLRIGLPFQSVSTGTRLIHDPMRLLAIVNAPKQRIEAILGKHSQVRGLLENRWISLVCLDTDDRYYSYEKGAWKLVPSDTLSG
jgi:uncharacterized protein